MSENTNAAKNPAPTGATAPTNASSSNATTIPAGKAASAPVGGIFNYLIARKKNATSDAAASINTGEDATPTTANNDGRRKSSKMKYHHFANAGGSYYFGSYDSMSDDSDNDDDNEPLFGAFKKRIGPATAAVNAINSGTGTDASDTDLKHQSWLASFQKHRNAQQQIPPPSQEQENAATLQRSSSWLTQFSQVGKRAWQSVDTATEWVYSTTSRDSGRGEGKDKGDTSTSWSSWVPTSLSLPSSLSSSISTTIATMSSYNPFSGDDGGDKTGADPLGNNSSLGDDAQSDSKPALLNKLALRSDLLWATKNRNPYQGVLGRDVDYLLSQNEDGIFSSYFNPFSWIGVASYEDSDLLIDGDDANVRADPLSKRSSIETSCDGKESSNSNRILLSKKKSQKWRQNHESTRKRNTPSDASVQAVKNLLELVQHQVVTPMVMESKIREGMKRRSASSFSSEYSFSSGEPELHGRENIPPQQDLGLPMLPLLTSSPKMSSPKPFPDISNLELMPKGGNNQQEPDQIPDLAKPSFDTASSYGPSPKSSPARVIPEMKSSSQHQLDQNVNLPKDNNSKSNNHNYGSDRNHNLAMHAEMAARLSEGTLRAYRDLALDEATELHSALHFWTIRWERPILGWLEAGPKVWFSEEGYSPWDAGKKMSQIQAVLARRCAAIGEMQQHLWRANWQQGVGQWGMLGGGVGGEWTAVVGGDGGMKTGYNENSSRADVEASVPSSPRQEKEKQLEVMRIFQHSRVIGTNISNSRGGTIVVDQEAMVSWSIDALRVIRDQLYRSGSGVQELPYVHHWPREINHFRGNSSDQEIGQTAYSDLPIWATEDVHGMSEVSKAAADEALIIEGRSKTPGTSTLQYPPTPSRPRLSENAPNKATIMRKNSTHSSIIISDLPSLTNEVSSLLESIEVHLEEQRRRRLDRLKPPSRMRRNWWVAAIGIPTGAYLIYKLTKRHGWLFLMRTLASKMSDIYRDHVSEPLQSIYQELFSHTGRLDVADKKARIEAIESLKKMIRSWLDESFPKMPLEEKVRLSEAMDISLIEQSKEESIKHILEFNSVVRMSLIEMQFIKKELFNALVAMDELMGSNEINMRIAAMTPAVIMVIAIRRAFRLLFYALFQVGKSKEEIYTSFRQTILDIERLLVMRDNPPPPPSSLPWGSTRPIDGNNSSSDFSDDRQHTLSADDLGMLLLHIHECRNILWQSRRRFRSDVLRNLSEDLAELAGERGPVSVRQQLQIISRMTRTYPFMKPNSGIPFDMIMPSWR